MGEPWGRRKSDKEDPNGSIWEEIGRLKEGYEIASKGYQTILLKIDALDQKVETLRHALYGNGPDDVGIFERIRSLAFKLSIVIFTFGVVGGFVGRVLERVIFK